MAESFKKMMFVLLVGLLAFSPAAAAEIPKDGAEILNRMEKELGTDSEKLEEIVPQLDAYSQSMQEEIEESVNKGFVELEAFSRKFAETTRLTEAKIKEMLTSEEYLQFKEFLAEIDQESVEQAKKKLAEEFGAVLDLTEEQALKVKPILEKGIADLSEAMAELEKSGKGAAEEFKARFEELSDALRKEIEKRLEGEQLEKFDRYQEQKEEKIVREVFEV